MIPSPLRFLLTVGLSLFAMAAAVRPCRAAPATADDLLQQKWSDMDISAGKYTGAGDISITAGKLVVWRPGAWLEKASFIAGNDSRTEVRGAFWREVRQGINYHGRLDAEDSGFDNCTIFKNTKYYDTQGPTTKWRFKNCVFAGRLFSEHLNMIDAGVKVENCTMVGLQTPHIWWRVNAGDEAQTDLLLFKNCRFIDCTIGAQFLMATVNCQFEGCQFNDYEQKKELSKEVKVTAYIAAGSKVPASFTNGKLSVFYRAEKPPVACGATVPFRHNAGKIAQWGAGAPMGTAQVIGKIAPPAAAPVADTPKPAATPTPSTPSPSVTGTDGAGEKALKQNTASINALVVVELPGQGEAGAASRLSAIALPTTAGQMAEVRFNQTVGSMMQKSLGEVAKHIQVRAQGWPRGQRIELSFADKFSPKDGPSAAVATALLLDSMIDGWKIDPAFAVTGDLNADGSVQPIGGVGGKIRGAGKAGCTRVGVPAKNAMDVADFVRLEGPTALAGVEVFSCTTFQEARDLAALPVENIQIRQAMDGFASVRRSLMAAGGGVALEKKLRDPQIHTLLSSVVTLAPNHLSARLLLAYGQGRLGRELSIRGSIETVEQQGGALIAAIKNRDSEKSLSTDQLSDQIFKMRRVRERVNPKARPALDALVVFAERIRSVRQNPPASRRNIDEANGAIALAAQNADLEWSKLINNRDVVEELMR